MKTVIAQLILNPEHNQHTAGYADGQAGYVDKRIRLVSADIADRDFQIIDKHNHPPVERIE